jgi:hypothetical protein
MSQEESDIVEQVISQAADKVADVAGAQIASSWGADHKTQIVAVAAVLVFLQVVSFLTVLQVRTDVGANRRLLRCMATVQADPRNAGDPLRLIACLR